MFQTFETPTSPEQSPPRVAKLRDWMAEKALDGFLVPRADKHQGEYVAPCDARLAWLTGFTGSAGFACILRNHAGVFIDGRYRLQVRNQVADIFSPVHWPEIGLAQWLKDHCDQRVQIGFDPWLHTITEIENLQQDLADTEISLVPTANGVDAIWEDRPLPPTTAATPQPLELAGEASDEKCTRLAAHLKKSNHKAAIITLPDSICWLLNIRGGDIASNPIVQAYAILKNDGHVIIFSDCRKFDNIELGAKVTKYDWDQFENHLKELEGPVVIDPSNAPIAVKTALGNQAVNGQDPCILPKACKNEVEIQGARTAHIRDGAAMCGFLAWLDTTDKAQLSEIDVIKKLEGFRQDTGKLKDISFETICGSGPNGAIVHYRVSHDSNRILDNNTMLLIDSGGQYQDGTTDLTRVIPLGEPSATMRTCFTRVLKGMIAISLARFPKGLAGRDLDPLARAPLWQAGLDYDHGTGHGVGSYLSVHEGPQRISRASEVPLQVGMILSNEPGYYRAGEFGIRIENLIVVQNAPQISGADDRHMLSFETLTYVPIDTRLIVTDMLSTAERTWLNDYHKSTYDRISPHVSEDVQSWLLQATKAI